ncbi:MAG TPA: FAD-dependent oxidoreductase, partial [Cytophagales bacterium]
MDILVIGNGMVGYKFCEKLLSKSNPHSFRLTVFGEEPRPAYDRVHLSSYFSGASGEALQLAPADWYLDNDIDLHTGELVVGIDRSRKRVTTAHGRTVAYDKMVLATGSAAFVPAIPGTEKDGVFVYRTIEDLEAIRAYAAGARRAAVIGGGLLGLEAAKAALDLG